MLKKLSKLYPFRASSPQESDEQILWRWLVRPFLASAPFWQINYRIAQKKFVFPILPFII